MSKSAFSAEGPVHLYLLHWSQHGRQITFLFSNVTSLFARATLLFYLFLDHKLALFVPFLPFLSQRFHLRVFTMLHLVGQNRNTDCQWPSQGASSKLCWKVVVGKLTTTWYVYVFLGGTLLPLPPFIGQLHSSLRFQLFNLNVVRNILS